MNHKNSIIPTLTSIIYERQRVRWLAYLDLIVEGKLEDIRNSIKNEDDLELFDSVVAMKDESGKALPMKYWGWLAKRYTTSQFSTLYTPENVFNMLMEFDKIANKNAAALAKRDITAVMSVEELADVLVKARTTLKNIEAEKKSASDYEVVLNQGQWLVVNPRSTAASCKLGAGTRWCISAKEDNMFSEYTSKGVKFLFVIDKTKTREDPYSKIAVGGIPINRKAKDHMLIDDFEVYDSQDTSTSIVDLWNSLPTEVLEAMRGWFNKNGVLFPATEEEEVLRVQSIPENSITSMANKMIEFIVYKEEAGETREASNMERMFKEKLGRMTTEQIAVLLKYANSLMNPNSHDTSLFAIKLFSLLSDEVRKREKAEGFSSVVDSLNWLENTLGASSLMIVKGNLSPSLSNLSADQTAKMIKELLVDKTAFLKAQQTVFVLLHKNHEQFAADLSTAVGVKVHSVDLLPSSFQELVDYSEWVQYLIDKLPQEKRSLGLAALPPDKRRLAERMVFTVISPIVYDGNAMSDIADVVYKMIFNKQLYISNPSPLGDTFVIYNPSTR